MKWQLLLQIHSYWHKCMYMCINVQNSLYRSCRWQYILLKYWKQFCNLTDQTSLILFTIYSTDGQNYNDCYCTLSVEKKFQNEKKIWITSSFPSSLWEFLESPESIPFLSPILVFTLLTKMFFLAFSNDATFGTCAIRIRPKMKQLVLNIPLFFNSLLTTH